MNKRGFVSKILQNFRKPEGFFGRMILWGMNTGHASLAQWGMSCLQWQPEWSVLDIGCGGGANLLQILQRCPQGKAYGIDISSESVTFARKKIKSISVHAALSSREESTDFPILIMRSMRSLLSRLSTSGVTCSMLLRKWRVC